VVVAAARKRGPSSRTWRVQKLRRVGRDGAGNEHVEPFDTVRCAKASGSASSPEVDGKPRAALSRTPCGGADVSGRRRRGAPCVRLRHTTARFIAVEDFPSSGARSSPYLPRRMPRVRQEDRGAQLRYASEAGADRSRCATRSTVSAKAAPAVGPRAGPRPMVRHDRDIGSSTRRPISGGSDRVVDRVGTGAAPQPEPTSSPAQVDFLFGRNGAGGAAPGPRCGCSTRSVQVLQSRGERHLVLAHQQRVQRLALLLDVGLEVF